MKEQFLTPYKLVTSVLRKLGAPIRPKEVQVSLATAKRLLEHMRMLGYDDEEISQMTDYICKGMLRDFKPRVFGYFFGVMRNYLDNRAGVTEAEANVVNIEQVVNNKKDVDKQ